MTAANPPTSWSTSTYNHERRNQVAMCSFSTSPKEFSRRLQRDGSDDIYMTVNITTAGAFSPRCIRGRRRKTRREPPPSPPRGGRGLLFASRRRRECRNQSLKGDLAFADAFALCRPQRRRRMQRQREMLLQFWWYPAMPERVYEKYLRRVLHR